MSIIASVAILILSMLISFCLQLVPGTFAIFYHYALGKTSAKKADDRALNFILGVEIFATIVWLVAYFSMFAFFYNLPSLKSIFMFILAGISFAEAIAVIFFYYRKGRATALFIPRGVAKGIIGRAEKSKSRSDCIFFGALIGLFELIFTFPLYFISASVLLDFDATLRVPIIIFYVLLSILPLLITLWAFKLGNNLADVERFRVKIKPLVKTILFFSFVTIGLATIYLGVINNG